MVSGGWDSGKHGGLGRSLCRRRSWVEGGGHSPLLQGRSRGGSTKGKAELGKALSTRRALQGIKGTS